MKKLLSVLILVAMAAAAVSAGALTVPIPAPPVVPNIPAPPVVPNIPAPPVVPNIPAPPVVPNIPTAGGTTVQTSTSETAGASGTTATAASEAEGPVLPWAGYTLLVKQVTDRNDLISYPSVFFSADELNAVVLFQVAEGMITYDFAKEHIKEIILTDGNGAVYASGTWGFHGTKEDNDHAYSFDILFKLGDQPASVLEGATVSLQAGGAEPVPLASIPRKTE